MRDNYVRRPDWEDLPWPVLIGILRSERDYYAETPVEKAVATEAVAHLEATIEKFTPKPPREGFDWRHPH